MDDGDFIPIVREAVPTPTRAPGGRTNAYVIGHRPALLVDPGAQTPELDELVQTRGVEHLLVTHTHPDHVGGVSHYSDSVTVWGHKDHTDRFREATGVTADDHFADGTRIDLGKSAVRVMATTGHAPDHVALVVGEDGPVCCGDCAVLGASVVVGGPGADMAAYVRSLQRLHSLDPPRLYPGHGPAIDDPRAELDRLVRHRARREWKILCAVENGARTLEEILDEAYEKDLTGVADLARATIVAHLEKLDAEGHLGWDGERARPN